MISAQHVPTYPYINDVYFAPVLAAMQAAGMPLASIHLEGNWYESGNERFFFKWQRATLRCGSSSRTSTTTTPQASGGSGMR